MYGNGIELLLLVSITILCEMNENDNHIIIMKDK